ncbi:MAG: hypothetical protein ABNH26_08910 [Celeribacter sp.]|jgi:hypothetical protein
MILSKRPSHSTLLAHLPKLGVALLACAVMIDAPAPMECDMAEVDGIQVCAFTIPAADLTAGFDPLDTTRIKGWF